MRRVANLKISIFFKNKTTPVKLESLRSNMQGFNIKFLNSFYKYMCQFIRLTTLLNLIFVTTMLQLRKFATWGTVLPVSNSSKKFDKFALLILQTTQLRPIPKTKQARLHQTVKQGCPSQPSKQDGHLFKWSTRKDRSNHQTGPNHIRIVCVYASDCVCDEPRTRSVRIIELHTCLPRRRWGVFSAVLLVIHWEKCAPTSHVQRCLRSCQKGSELFFSFHSVAVQEIWTDHHRRRRWGRHQFLRPTPPPLLLPRVTNYIKACRPTCTTVSRLMLLLQR